MYINVNMLDVSANGCFISDVDVHVFTRARLPLEGALLSLLDRLYDEDTTFDVISCPFVEMHLLLLQL